TSPYPLASPAAGTRGIGPNPVIAVDNTLGSFTTHQGRIYVAYVGIAFSQFGLAYGGTNGTGGTVYTDNTKIYLQASDDGGRTWHVFSQFGFPSPRQVNDDSLSDNFSEGNRPHFMPEIAVDQTTGTLVLSFFDARWDASRARVTNILTTSIDGGATFSVQQNAYVN